jgi:hypothetical protein
MAHSGGRDARPRSRLLRSCEVRESQTAEVRRREAIRKALPAKAPLPCRPPLPPGCRLGPAAHLRKRLPQHQAGIPGSLGQLAVLPSHLLCGLDAPLKPAAATARQRKASQQILCGLVAHNGTIASEACGVGMHRHAPPPKLIDPLLCSCWTCQHSCILNNLHVNHGWANLEPSASHLANSASSTPVCGR